jgi:3-dehydroshikimate dehydratase
MPLVDEETSVAKLHIAPILFASACLFSSAEAATFIVNRNLDDGSVNTLRWAILQSNATPGPNTVLVRPPYRDWVIMLQSPLPPIKGPAVVSAVGAEYTEYRLPPSAEAQVSQPVIVPASYGKPSVVLDGSGFVNTSSSASCPAQNGIGSGTNVRSLINPALQVIDSGNVDISGFEIRNVCIGVMLLRSHDNHVHHNLIHNVVGAAGILVTGDDGSVAGNSTAGLSTANMLEYNVLYNTGDGMECSRGTTNSTYQYNIGYETRTGVAPYSQGIECAGSGNAGISFLFNRFLGYSDGLQPNGTSGLIVRGNFIEGSTYGIDPVTGTDIQIVENVITRNRLGIGVPRTGSLMTISRNKIFDNGQPLVSLPTSAGGTTNSSSPALLGIDAGADGVTANNPPGVCTSASVLSYPVLNASSSSWRSGELSIDGAMAACANAYYVIELFANRSLNPAGFAEGEIYLGSIAVATDAAGNGRFHFHVNAGRLFEEGDTRQAYITATATNAAGGTSEFSAPIALVRGRGD